MIHAEYGLSDDELGKLAEATPVIKKFLEFSISQYQLGLAFGKYKGEEANIYARIEALLEEINRMENFPGAKQAYEKKLQEDIEKIKGVIEEKEESSDV